MISIEWFCFVVKSILPGYLGRSSVRYYEVFVCANMIIEKIVMDKSKSISLLLKKTRTEYPLLIKCKEKSLCTEA